MKRKMILQVFPKIPNTVSIVVLKDLFKILRIFVCLSFALIPAFSIIIKTKNANAEIAIEIVKLVQGHKSIIVKIVRLEKRRMTQVHTKTLSIVLINVLKELVKLF